MRNFKDFFSINEVLDAEKIQKINPVLRKSPYGDGYVYEFKINGDNYDISMNSHSISIKSGRRDSYGMHETITHRGYEVIFRGPQGSVALTNKRIATEVYSHLLAGMNKFIDQVRPEGLYFYGAYEGMDLMYNRFVKKFLNDSPDKPEHMVFFQLDEKNYISKECLGKLDPDMQETVKEVIEDWKGQEKEFLQNKKQEKAGIREQIKKLLGAVGNFIYDNYDGCFGIVYTVSGRSLEAVVLSYYGLRTKRYSANRIFDSYYEQRLFTPQEVFSSKFLANRGVLSGNIKEDVMNFLDNLFDPEKAKNNEEYIKLIRQNVPQNVIDFITRIYLKMNPNKRQRITAAHPAPGLSPTRRVSEPPSIPRRRPILQTWQRHTPAELRSGEFEDE